MVVGGCHGGRVVSLFHAGQRLTVTDTGEAVVIWDAAPGPGCYWAHRLPSNELVLIQVRQHRSDAHPEVIIKEAWE